jgi:hypothetical protein
LACNAEGIWLIGFGHIFLRSPRMFPSISFNEAHEKSVQTHKIKGKKKNRKKEKENFVFFFFPPSDGSPDRRPGPASYYLGASISTYTTRCLLRIEILYGRSM